MYKKSTNVLPMKIWKQNTLKRDFRLKKFPLLSSLNCSKLQIHVENFAQDLSVYNFVTYPFDCSINRNINVWSVAILLVLVVVLGVSHLVPSGIFHTLRGHLVNSVFPGRIAMYRPRRGLLAFGLCRGCLGRRRQSWIRSGLQWPWEDKM